MNLRLAPPVLSMVLLLIPAGAQQRTARKPATTTTAPKPQGLTVDSIIAMAQAGLSDEVITARLRKEDKAMDLSPDDLIRLKKANVSDVVLKVMMDPKAETRPVAPTQPPPQPAAPIVVQTPVIAGMPIVNPSGATPSAGTTAAGDPNDPMTPHDSGIYLLSQDRDGKPLMIVLERAAYQGAKTGGMFGTAMTYGIKKAKTKAIIPGPRAGVRSTESSPLFYFYFDDKAAGLGKSYFGMANVTNPNQFALLKLDVAKSNRETIIGEFNAYGSTSGTSEKAMMGFKSERIRPGLYKVVMNSPLLPGEYCFLASSGIAGAYGAGAAGAGDLFDFGVNSNQ